MDSRELCYKIRQYRWSEFSMSVSLRRRLLNSSNPIADSQTQKQEFRNDPYLYLQYCKAIEQELNSRFKFIIKGSSDQNNVVKVRLSPWSDIRSNEYTGNGRRYEKTAGSKTSSGQKLDSKICLWMPSTHAWKRLPGSLG